MEDSLNIIYLIKLIKKWRKPLMIVCAVALVGSIIISSPFIMKPEYKSKSIVLASNPGMLSSQALFIESSADYFGTESDIDRVVAIANSTPLRSYIIAKYKLFQHYDIDSADTEYPNYKIGKEFEDKYSVLKNEKGAIEITIYDTDKNLAAEMCNEVVSKVDDINNTIILENKQKIYNVYVNKINNKQAEMGLLSDSIVKTKAKYDAIYSIMDMNRAISLADSTKRKMDKFDEQLTILEEQRKAGLKELNNTISLAEQYRSTLNKDVPSIYIVEKAYPAEKKSKPVRWLIVLGSLVGTFALSVIFLIFMERVKYIQQRLKDDAAA